MYGESRLATNCIFLQKLNFQLKKRHNKFSREENVGELNRGFMKLC